MKIPIINQSHHPLPSYATAGSSGVDLRAYINEDIILQSGQRLLIPTGLYMAIPSGYEGQIRPRSGLALKHGITVLNSPGTIDSDYRGEVKVLLMNLSDRAFLIQDGDRIAQLIILPYTTADWQPTTVFSDTERGTDGFGSSGKS